MKRGNLLFALGVTAAILAVTALLLVYIRRGEAPAPAPAAPKFSYLSLCC